MIGGTHVKIAIKCLCLVGASLLAMAPLHAEEFSVGRAEVQLPNGPWRELSLPDAGKDYGGDVSGNIPSETKLFVKEGAGQTVEALVLVRSSSGAVRGGTMTYSGECQSNKDSFGEAGQSWGRGSTQCLRVLRQFGTRSLLKVLAPQLTELMEGNTHLPPGMFTVLSQGAVGTGTFLDVRVFLAPTFVGASDPVDAQLIEGVKASHVAWGRHLREAVRSSVFSLSGKLVFPPFEFKSGEAVAVSTGWPMPRQVNRAGEPAAAWAHRSADLSFLVSEIPVSRTSP